MGRTIMRTDGSAMEAKHETPGKRLVAPGSGSRTLSVARRPSHRAYQKRGVSRMQGRRQLLVVPIFVFFDRGFDLPGLVRATRPEPRKEAAFSRSDGPEPWYAGGLSVGRLRGDT